MAKSKKLTDEQNRARARRDSHSYRHKTNNLPARTANRAARLAAQWVQEAHPQKWAALVRQAKAMELENTTTYTPHSVKYAKGDCPHGGKIEAVGIMRRCCDCGEFLGTWPVENPANAVLLQEILEAEDGA